MKMYVFGSTDDYYNTHRMYVERVQWDTLRGVVPCVLMFGFIYTETHYLWLDGFMRIVKPKYLRIIIRGT